MNHRRWNRLALGVAGALLVLAGCGASQDSPGSDETAGVGDPGAVPDLEDPGDDLLESTRRGVELAGLSQRVTWRFPESYETSFSQTQQATARDGEVELQLTVGAKPGVDRVSEGESLAEDADAATQLGVEGVDVEGTTEEVMVGGIPFTLATLDSPESSLRAFFLTPDDEDATYAVLFRAGTSLEDTPDERMAELYQMVASLELEPKQGLGG